MEPSKTYRQIQAKRWTRAHAGSAGSRSKIQTNASPVEPNSEDEVVIDDSTWVDVTNESAT